VSLSKLFNQPVQRFRNDLKRFEPSQPRVHRDDGVSIWSYVTCHGISPIVFYDGSLDSEIYICILDKHLPTAFERFSSQSSREIFLQQDNARSHASMKTRNYLKRRKLHPISW
ncbi:unnamed protein product, partial [Rotaria sp. Silwood2]